MPRTAQRTAKGATQQAFSLLEMAIVVAVVGLIIGGVMATQDFVRKAEISAGMAEVDSVTKALNTFVSNYHALPGDMGDAEAYWGARGTCPGTGLDGQNTCNGNNDGRIEHSGSYAFEQFTAFQHMAQAGLIEGTYTGAPGPASNRDAEIGVNVPESSIENAGIGIGWTGVQTGTATYYDGNYGHAISIGAENGNNYAIAPILTPQEALNIDLKIDDGKPSYGEVVVFKSGTNPNCATSDTAASAEYNLTYSEIACAVVFRNRL